MSEKLPEGWVERPLLSVLETIVDYRGISVPKAESGIPLITARNIRDGFYDFSEQEYIDSQAYRDWISRGRPQNNDILFTTEAPLGKACLFPKNGQYAIGQRVISLRPRAEIMHSNYLLYFLLSEECQTRINFRATGTTAKGIKSSEIKKVKICYPNLPEQQTIARILTTWDAAITCIQTLLENSKQQKKALMQQLLRGRRRLPGFSGKWLKIQLGKLFERVTTRNGNKCTTVVTISAQQGLIRQEDFFNKSVASSILDNYFLIKNGDFAYNKSYSKGYPFGAIKRLNKYEFGVVTSLYICFSLHDASQGDKDFFEHFFEYGALNSSLEKIAHEGGRAHGLLNVKPEDFFAIHMTIPPLDEQKAITKILTAADALIAQYEVKLAHLQQQKKALMQQLLTGKIRVTPDTPGASDDACETPV